MWSLIFFFILGIAVGTILKKREKFLTISSKLMELCVFLLLFWLGYLMGTDKNVINNLLTMGIDAIILSLFSIIGSILFIIPLSRKIK